MFIFREESQIFGNVDFLYCNKRCLRSDTLQHALCFVAERAIRFCVELELYRFRFQLFLLMYLCFLLQTFHPYGVFK